MELTPQIQEHTIQVDNRDVYYTARGPEDAEYVYVGINGLMGGGDSFWPVIAGVPNSWRVILPDLPGCGNSEPMEAPHKHNISGYADWLERFLGELGLLDRRIVLASVATGAPISIRYARKHSEKVAGQILHLPMLGKIGISAKWVRPIIAYALKSRLIRELVDNLRQRDAVMHRIILHEPPDAIPVLAERDIRHKQQADLPSAGELLHDLMLTDARTELALISQPTLILASEHDFSAPLPLLESIVADRPERRLHVYRGGQHSWNEDFIAAMNDEIHRFLRKVENKA